MGGKLYLGGTILWVEHAVYCREFVQLCAQLGCAGAYDGLIDPRGSLEVGQHQPS